MKTPTLEFWFDFASTYSYIASMRIEALCAAANVTLVWRPFLLGPIFQLQGWKTSPFVGNSLRGDYMWRDMERLTAKYGLPWKRPSVFPRNSTLACRVAAAFSDAPWIAGYVRAAFLANFRDDAELNDERSVGAILRSIGQDADAVLQTALHTDARRRLRANTEQAIALGIFGAPNCVVGSELFWGEEALEDAIAWARPDPNADLREARLRYSETHPFPLYSHIDMRVSDADAVRSFYDALMPLFGTEPTTPRVVRYGYTRRYGAIRADFFNIFEDPQTRPTLTRIAFAAPTPSFVDEVARVVRLNGGRNIEGPQYFEQHHPTFYAVFFEDPLGNRFEVCHHRMDR
jgi:2-hydroxychromene-2-carboxylate isomerase/catechol 2,3-dioxygenase-like lactoylglutathione lyase family enzyme